MMIAAGRDEAAKWQDIAQVAGVQTAAAGFIREFLPNALDAAKLDDRRIVVWVKEPALFRQQELGLLFGDDVTAVAAVLGGDRTVAAWVHDDRLGVDDADFAFSAARG